VTRVTIEVQRGGSRRFTVLAGVQTDKRGYWTLVSGVRANRWRVRWVGPQGVIFTGPPIGAY
jgi:hypothetical protein